MLRPPRRIQTVGVHRRRPRPSFVAVIARGAQSQEPVRNSKSGFLGPRVRGCSWSSRRRLGRLSRGHEHSGPQQHASPEFNTLRHSARRMTVPTRYGHREPGPQPSVPEPLHEPLHEFARRETSEPRPEEPPISEFSLPLHVHVRARQVRRRSARFFSMPSWRSSPSRRSARAAVGA